MKDLKNWRDNEDYKKVVARIEACESIAMVHGTRDYPGPYLPDIIDSLLEAQKASFMEIIVKFKNEIANESDDWLDLKAVNTLSQLEDKLKEL